MSEQKKVPKKKEAQIPRPRNKDDKKNLEIVFMKSFGKSYNKLKKEELAMMIFTLQQNYNKLHNDAYNVTRIGLAMKRQRDHYHKLLRTNHE